MSGSQRSKDVELVEVTVRVTLHLEPDHPLVGVAPMRIDLGPRRVVAAAIWRTWVEQNDPSLDAVLNAEHIVWMASQGLPSGDE